MCEYDSNPITIRRRVSATLLCKFTGSLLSRPRYKILTYVQVTCRLQPFHFAYSPT